WNLCVKHGVVLRYIDEHLSSDRPDDRESFYYQSVAAERERRLISKRTREGIARVRATAKAKGTPDPWTGRKKCSFGQRTKELMADILLDLHNGVSVRRISNRYNVNRWTVNNIKEMPIEQIRDKCKNPKLRDWREV